MIPDGAPDHFSAGEVLPPVQPKPENTCSSGIFAPGAMSGLVSSRALADAEASRAAPKTNAALDMFPPKAGRTAARFR